MHQSITCTLLDLCVPFHSFKMEGENSGVVFFSSVCFCEVCFCSAEILISGCVRTFLRIERFGSRQPGVS